MLSEAFLKRLDELRLRMKHTAAGGAGGVRRSKALGSSVEFSDFREYAPGDDVRRVDWNAYARFDRLFLKLFMEEREQLVNIIVDASASMGFGEPEKFAAARTLAEALCYISLGAGDRVTLYSLSGGMGTHSRAFASKAQYPDAAAFLDALTPLGDAAIDAALPLLPLPHGRGVSVLISDLLCDYGRALYSLAYRKQQTCVVQVMCAEDMSPAFEDTMELIDSETGGRLVVNADFELMRAYRETAQGYVKEACARCASLGFAHALLVPEQPLEERLIGLISRTGLTG